MGHLFSRIRKESNRQINILKYSTVIANYNSNVFLPKLIANLCKLESKIRIKNVVLLQEHCLKTASQQNKRLIDYTQVVNVYTSYLQSYFCPE